MKTAAVNEVSGT